MMEIESSSRKIRKLKVPQPVIQSVGSSPDLHRFFAHQIIMIISRNWVTSLYSSLGGGHFCVLQDCLIFLAPTGAQEMLMFVS